MLSDEEPEQNSDSEEAALRRSAMPPAPKQGIKGKNMFSFKGLDDSGSSGKSSADEN